jgi:hypothetical protein
MAPRFGGRCDFARAIACSFSAGTLALPQRLRAMKPLAWVGVLLIVLGVIGLVVENVSFTERRTVLDVGPIKVQADEQRIVPIPTIAGIVAIAIGLGLVFMSRKRA